VLTKSLLTSGKPAENENRGVFVQISLENHDFSASEGRLKHFVSSLLAGAHSVHLVCLSLREGLHLLLETDKSLCQNREMESQKTIRHAFTEKY